MVLLNLSHAPHAQTSIKPTTIYVRQNPSATLRVVKGWVCGVSDPKPILLMGVGGGIVTIHNIFSVLIVSHREWGCKNKPNPTLERPARNKQIKCTEFPKMQVVTILERTGFKWLHLRVLKSFMSQCWVLWLYGHAWSYAFKGFQAKLQNKIWEEHITAVAKYAVASLFVRVVESTVKQYFVLGCNEKTSDIYTAHPQPVYSFTKVAER